ncbi:MAG: Alpha/Beta hydrolase protein [Monoraphidium minutum]|nr:MAG: Alpha/Beta hydrolase protein [Monoraphidium minutum]
MVAAESLAATAGRARAALLADIARGRPRAAPPAVVLPELASYAARGYIAATLDNRYHGERACAGLEDSGGGGGADRVSGGGGSGNCYQRAIIRAWRGESGERPLLLDNAWDYIHLLDILEASPDVDARRIGMGGISLGGMITWLVAAADERVSVAAPAIGIQGWGWALKNDSWQARLASLGEVGPAAAADMGKAAPDAAVAEALLRKLMPGLLDEYDTRTSLLAIAPRPFLAINGALDARCPLPGVQQALAAAAAEGYAAADAAEGALQLRSFEGVGHEYTPAMAAAAAEWFEEWL